MTLTLQQVIRRTWHWTRAYSHVTENVPLQVNRIVAIPAYDGLDELGKVDWTPRLSAEWNA